MVVGVKARLGPHKIRFRKMELNTGSDSGKSKKQRANNQYVELEVVNFRIEISPDLLSSTGTSSFRGEIPFLKFQEKHFSVPFEGSSFPVTLALSHAPTHRIKLRLRTVKPAQEELVRISSTEVYIEAGHTQVSFFVVSSIGAASGMIEVSFADKNLARKVKIPVRSVYLDIVDFDTALPQLNRVTIDGTESFLKNQNNTTPGLFDPREHKDRSRLVLQGSNSDDFFKNELLEIQESDEQAGSSAPVRKSSPLLRNPSTSNPESEGEQEQAAIPMGQSVRLYFSKKVRVYALVLSFPAATYPEFEVLSAKIDYFSHQSREESMDFGEEHLRVFKQTTEYSAEQGGYFAEFRADTLCIDRHFDSRVLFLVEDGSNERLISDLKLLVRGESKINFAT